MNRKSGDFSRQERLKSSLPTDFGHTHLNTPGSEPSDWTH
jgi:hypothetical protein